MKEGFARRVASQSIHSTVFFGVRAVAQILLAVSLGKSLAPAAYGTYSLIGTTLAFASYLLQLGAHQYLLREVPGRPSKQSATLFKSIVGIEVILTIFVIAAALAVLVVSPRISALLGFHGNGVIPYVLGSLLLGDIVSTELLRYLAARTEIEHSNIVGFFQKPFWSLIVYGAFLIGGSRAVTLPLVFELWAAGLTAAIVYGLGRAGITDLRRAEFSAEAYLTAVKFGLPLMFTNVSAVVLDWADRYFIVAYYSTTVLGIYAFQYNIILMIVAVSAPVIGNVLDPYIVAAFNVGDTRRSSGLLSASLRYRLVLITPIIIGVSLWSQNLLSLLARAEYTSATSLLAVLAPIPVLTLISNTFERILFLERRTIIVGRNYMLAAAVNLGLNFLLVPRHPYYGAALATDLALTLLAFMMWHQTRTSPIQLDAALPRIAIATVPAVGVGLLLAHFTTTQAPWALAVGTFITAGIYAVALWLLRVFPRAEIRMGLQIIREGTVRLRKFTPRGK